MCGQGFGPKACLYIWYPTIAIPAPNTHTSKRIRVNWKNVLTLRFCDFGANPFLLSLLLARPLASRPAFLGRRTGDLSSEEIFTGGLSSPGSAGERGGSEDAGADATSACMVALVLKAGFSPSGIAPAGSASSPIWSSVGTTACSGTFVTTGLTSGPVFFPSMGGVIIGSGTCGHDGWLAFITCHSASQNCSTVAKRS